MKSTPKKFNYEELVGNLAAIIAVLAIFISCLGLFGLASFTAEQRVKEIGVRKVLGASVASLWQLLSKDFVKLVLISCVIAMPVAWYFMNEWLKNYEYKIDIGVGIFVMVIGLSIVITLVTVSFQAIRAARGESDNQPAFRIVVPEVLGASAGEVVCVLNSLFPAAFTPESGKAWQGLIIYNAL